jgi:hypothetical protein
MAQSLYEWRKGKPKPGDIMLYEGNYNEDGIECRGATFQHKVEVQSWPIKDHQGSPLVFARCRPGDPMTARWLPVDALKPCKS